MPWYMSMQCSPNMSTYTHTHTRSNTCSQFFKWDYPLTHFFSLNIWLFSHQLLTLNHSPRPQEPLFLILTFSFFRNWDVLPFLIPSLSSSTPYFPSPKYTQTGSCPASFLTLNLHNHSFSSYLGLNTAPPFFFVQVANNLCQEGA